MDRKGVSSKSMLLIGALVIGGLCLFAVFGGLGNLFGGGSNRPSAQQDGGGLFGGGQAQGDLGQMYAAVEVDRNGCPVQPAQQFYMDESIFVGLDRSRIPAGTEMFVRLYHEGRPVEDTEPVYADQAMDTCVWFEFAPERGTGFEPGDYEAELIVNGNRADQVAFEVTDSTAGNSGGFFPGTGSGGLELGQVVATTAVDNNGCPTDQVSEFYQNESVFVSMTESYIPQGTEMFARLWADGRAVEDTDPIVADQDLQTCVWFEFQGTSFGGGLEPGNYEAELYANGSVVDTVQFVVR